MTGFYRDGACQTGPDDLGIHTVCAEMTEQFLNYTKAQGNDLTTPFPDADFPGLKPGERWCLCASRWHEAYMDGVAPPVILEATHVKTLDTVSLFILKKNSVNTATSPKPDSMA